MSNIDRKYAYHDDGVLPAQGEYGVTYLTLYSSGAGNTYDGWIWDPDRINYSETARTFGYRNPSYPDYCWDDEVVVDLSNAQTRQESSSDSAQGRIVSFNTNVSDRPILLRDIDVTGMTEEEREARATTVLFTAIPLVKDAYIQANIEIAMKMNLSPNNTTGNVRVEAFYIINNESDRTMRPHPINYYSVARADEYNIFNPIYFNLALNHEDHNYIGVKLIVSGGTAEIGISDDPDYGDAIITITSFGMTGDNVYSGKPQSLEIYGKEYVPIGYKINEADYTVLCTYDTGEIYDVSRLCDYNPNIGTKIVDPVTTLSAYYQGLTASMYLYLAQVESIELIGLSDFYGDEYELNRDDYVVMAYYDTGDIMDVTNEQDLTFSPAMGTTITDDTRLTATYMPEYMPGSTFEDSMDITKHAPILTAYNNENGLQYHLYDNYLIDITGNSRLNKSDGSIVNEVIELPTSIKTYFNANHIVNYRMKWSATGDIGGFKVLYAKANSVQDYPEGEYGILSKLINFDNVRIKPYYIQYPSNQESDIEYNPITFSFAYTDLTSNDLMFIKTNTDYITVGNKKTIVTPFFAGCLKITNLDFAEGWDLSEIEYADSMFKGCVKLNDISATSSWVFDKIIRVSDMFASCTDLKNVQAVSEWNLSKVQYADRMFRRSGLISMRNLANCNMGTYYTNNIYTSCEEMFAYSDIESLNGFSNFYNNCKIKSLYRMFAWCDKLKNLSGCENALFSRYDQVYFTGMFMGCSNLEYIGAITMCDTSTVTRASTMFYECDKIKDPYTVGNMDLHNCTDFRGMLATLAYDSTESVNIELHGENIIFNNIFKTTKRQGVTVIDYNSASGRKYNRTTKQVQSGGMFGNRDCFYISAASDPGYPFIEFEHPSLLPDWYKKMIAENITPGVIYSYN